MSRDGVVRRLGLVAGRDGSQYKLVKEPMVEIFSLQCESPVTAMALGQDHVLTGLNNAQVAR